MNFNDTYQTPSQQYLVFEKMGGLEPRQVDTHKNPSQLPFILTCPLTNSGINKMWLEGNGGNGDLAN